MKMNAGIESLAFYTPGFSLGLEELARHRRQDPRKFVEGLGQHRMSVPPPDEDVVTMAANAAVRALDGVDTASLDSIIFATESGIDQSKAAAIYVHQLIGLPTTCKAFEIKQACCGSTAALQMAQALVTLRPDRRVLIVASDVARYGLGTPGEPTQGAGAMAILVSATPKLLSFDPESGSYTEDVMDFWRPNYMDEALVDGKYSIKIYLKALSESWKGYHADSGRAFADFTRFCYHLPFTRMAEKAHRHLARITGQGDLTEADLETHLRPSLRYNQVTGNSYTASLYVGLTSLLETDPADLSGQRIGLFSYGSGCMASYFSGVVLKDYRNQLRIDEHRRMLDDRIELTVPEYERFYEHRLPVTGEDYATTVHTRGRFRLAGIHDHKRIYEQVTATAVPVTPEAALSSV